ncbi:hypothetical protein JMJ77_0000941, partial [Colletotrichum scovillei]
VDWDISSLLSLRQALSSTWQLKTTGSHRGYEGNCAVSPNILICSSHGLRVLPKRRVLGGLPMGFDEGDEAW